MRSVHVQAYVVIDGQDRQIICHKDVFSLAEYLHPFVLILFFSRSLYKLVVTAVTPPRPIISTPRYEHIKEGVGVNIIPYPVPSGNLVVQILDGRQKDLPFLVYKRHVNPQIFFPHLLNYLSYILIGLAGVKEVLGLWKAVSAWISSLCQESLGLLRIKRKPLRRLVVRHPRRNQGGGGNLTAPCNVFYNPLLVYSHVQGLPDPHVVKRWSGDVKAQKEGGKKYMRMEVFTVTECLHKGKRHTVEIVCTSRLVHIEARIYAFYGQGVNGLELHVLGVPVKGILFHANSIVYLPLCQTKWAVADHVFGQRPIVAACLHALPVYRHQCGKTGKVQEEGRGILKLYLQCIIVNRTDSHL